MVGLSPKSIDPTLSVHKVNASTSVKWAKAHYFQESLTCGLYTFLYRNVFGRNTIAAISVTEVVTGLTRTQHMPQLEAFRRTLAAVEVLSIGAPEADLAGQITGALIRGGDTIGVVDPLIAAVAITHDLVLVTGNANHFQRIQQLGYPLTPANWREPASA